MSELSQAIDAMRNMRESYDQLVENMPSESALKQRYSARFEQNADGADTYTMVMPLCAGVEQGVSPNEVTITM